MRPRNNRYLPLSARPGAIWSGPRPCSPNSSPDPSVRHSVPVPPATTPETPQRQPIPESADGRWNRSRSGGVQGFPLAAGARHVADASGAGTVGNPRSAPAEPMGVHTRGDQGHQHFPQLVGDLERTGGGIGFGGRPSTLRTWRLGVFRFGHYPSLAATLTSRPPMGRHVSASY